MMNNNFFYIVVTFSVLSISDNLSASWYSGFVAVAKYVVGYEEDKAEKEQRKVSNDLLPKQISGIERCADQIGQLRDAHSEIGSNISGQISQVVQAQHATNVSLGKGINTLDGIKDGVYLIGSVWAAKDVVMTGYNAVIGARKWLLPTAEEKAQAEAASQDVFNELARVKARTAFTRCILDHRKEVAAEGGVPAVCQKEHALFAALSNTKRR